MVVSYFSDIQHLVNWVGSMRTRNFNLKHIKKIQTEKKKPKWTTTTNKSLRIQQCPAYTTSSSSPSHHHHHHLSLNREGRWGATDDFATSFLHFSLFSTALWDLANSGSVHSLMLSSCLPTQLHQKPSYSNCSFAFRTAINLLTSENLIHRSWHTTREAPIHFLTQSCDPINCYR